MHKKIVEKKSELDELLQMRLKKIIDDSQYSNLKNNLQNKIKILEKDESEVKIKVYRFHEKVKNLFNKITDISTIFALSNPADKKMHLLDLCSYWRLKDKKLYFEVS